MTRVTTARQFSALVRRSIRDRVADAKFEGVKTRTVTFPTGLKGFISRGTVTGAGRTASFTAIGTNGTLSVNYYGEQAA